MLGSLVLYGKRVILIDVFAKRLFRPFGRDLLGLSMSGLGGGEAKEVLPCFPADGKSNVAKGGEREMLRLLTFEYGGHDIGCITHGRKLNEVA